MPLTEYFRLLRRWGWLLVLTALLLAGAAYVFSKTQRPVYQASIQVGIQPTRPDLSLTTSAQSLLLYYVSVIHTQTYAQKVITDLQLDRTPGSLLGDVTIAADPSRFVITINVKNGDGDVANNIASDWASEFKAWRDDQNAQVQLTDKVDALVLDAPKYTLYRPTTKINVLAGAILGLLLGGVIVFLVEYVQAGIIRSSADMDLMQLPVLGAIPGEAAPAEHRQSPR
jgi:capsular polysaccharide biosynthesis protein